MIRTSTRLACLLALMLAVVPAAMAYAQDDAAVLKPAEPDYTLIDLPTSLALPTFGTAIRITHRFILPLNCSTCPNSLLGDAFRIDGGAFIGLEFRIGVVKNGQLVVHRAQRKQVEFLGEYTAAHQTDSMPFEIAALAAIEGTENFTGSHATSVGLALTHLFGDQAAIHVDPIWVHKSDFASDDTLMVGVGARVQIAKALYVTAEITPRLSGLKPGANLASFAIEKRMGGHMFQLNFSNSNLGTTFQQIAGGAPDNNHWYMGFNITRKFF